jgi:hypothetical protein
MESPAGGVVRPFDGQLVKVFIGDILQAVKNIHAWKLDGIEFRTWRSFTFVDAQR